MNCAKHPRLSSHAFGVCLVALCVAGGASSAHAQQDPSEGVRSTALTGLQARSLMQANPTAENSGIGQFWYSGARLGSTTGQAVPSVAPQIPAERWALSGGYRWANGHSLGLVAVQDSDMPSLRSQVQLVYQTTLIGPGQVMLGLNNKTVGLMGQTRQATGLSVGYDWSGMSLRMNYEPWVSDTLPSALRFSVSTKF